MPITPQDTISVRFAKAMGYIQGDSWTGWLNKDGNIADEPDPTNANTVRKALMGMTEEEWDKFTLAAREKLQLWGASPRSVIYHTLKTPLSTLAEIYCEVKGEK